jgi:transposase
MLKNYIDKEKEELVIKLAKEGKTTREIAKIAHISLKDIGEIIRKFTGDDKKDSDSIKLAEKEMERLSKLSPCTKAF